MSGDGRNKKQKKTKTCGIEKLRNFIYHENTNECKPACEKEQNVIKILMSSTYQYSYP